MTARSQVVVLEFNASVGLKQAETELGELRFKQQFSKVTQSWVAERIILKKNKMYVNHLMDKLCIYNDQKKNISFLIQTMFPRISH